MLPIPRSPRLFRLCLPALMLALAAVPAAAQPSAPAPPPADSQAVPVVLTISGGISLGSYQSGVNWALVNFFRHSYHSQEFRDAYGIRAHRLAVATGASAGNINAVLSTLDWCAAYEPVSQPAEQSLLWKAWIGMGIGELFPNDPTTRRRPVPGDTANGFGIFRRTAFKRLYGREIRTRFDQLQNADCSVAVGMTLTRVDRDSIELNRQIWPRAQRFASTFRIAAPPGGAGPLQIHSARDTVRRARVFGRMIAPVPDVDGAIPYMRVMELVEASSAFPLAFEPVRVHYFPPDRLDPSGACPRVAGGGCASPDSALFIDGGVFDNNPLSLAIQLFGHEPHAPTPVGERYIYIDPDGVRLDSLRRKPAPQDSLPSGLGLAGIGSLVGGAVPAARQYELHSLARSLAGGTRERIRVTDRGHRLVSSHLGAFAGFLGRPFREFDFYVGMYDGMYYVAHDIVCADSAGDTAAVRRCTGRQLPALLSDRRFNLSDYAGTVVAHLFREEFRNESPRVAPPTAQPPLAQVLMGIDGALHAAAVDTLCGAGSPVARALCREGFTAFVRRLRNARVDTLTARLRPGTGCTDNGSDCFDDPEMDELVHDPDRYLARLASRVVDRAETVERGLGRRGHPSSFALVGAVYHLGAGEPRRGMEWDPSSVPDTRGSWWRHFTHGVPYYLGFGSGGGVETGYRPSYYLGRGAAIVLPVLPIHFSPTRDPARDQFYLGYGAGLHLRVRGPFGAEATYQALHPYAELGRPVHTVEGGVVLAEKLRVGARYVLSDPGGVYPAARGLRVDGLSLTFGILDVNGLTYWVGRLIAP